MEIFAKKKIKVALAALIIWAGARFGLELDPAAVDRVLELAMVVIAAIGLEDWGKARVAEAAKTGGSMASVEITTTIPPPVAPASPLPPPLGQGRQRTGQPTPTTAPGRPLSEARAVREEARQRTPAPVPPLPTPPKRSGP